MRIAGGLIIEILEQLGMGLLDVIPLVERFQSDFPVAGNDRGICGQ